MNHPLSEQQQKLLADAYSNKANCLVILDEAMFWRSDEARLPVAHTSARFLYADIEDLLARQLWYSNPGDGVIYFTPLAWQLGRWLNAYRHDEPSGS